MGETEAWRDGARTLAIVVARCSSRPTPSPLSYEAAADTRRYGGRFALERARSPGCVGTAEVLHRQLRFVEDLAPQRVLLIEADALRGIDYASLIDAHVARGLGATLAYAEIAARADASRGTVLVDSCGRVLRLDAAALPRAASTSTRCVPAGAYVLDRELLVDCLEVDAAEPLSERDFRSDVLPMLVRANGVAAHRVRCAERPPAGGLRRQAFGDVP